MNKTYKVNGMECNHCKMTVENALKSLPGVTEVMADPGTGIVIVTGNTDDEAVKKAVEAVGFTIE